MLRGGATDEQLAAELRDAKQHSKHKYPRAIEFVPDVPKNDRGKVDRGALRAAGGKAADAPPRGDDDREPGLRA